MAGITGRKDRAPTPFENDVIIPCSIGPDCLESVCQNYSLAFMGTQSYNLQLGNGLSSGGSVQFEITVSGTPLDAPNDLICNAVGNAQVVIEPGEVLFAVGFSVLCALLASLLPALRAASLDPVEALRYE